MKLKHALVGATALSVLASPMAYAAVADPVPAATAAGTPIAVAKRAHKRKVVANIRRGLRYASPGATAGRVSPEVLPGAPLPGPVQAGPKGPLASLGKTLEDHGIFVHLLEIETYYNNLNSGIVKDTGANTAFLLAGADFDMGKLANIAGGTVHFQEQIFHGLYNVATTSERYGSLTSGYEPIYNPTDNQLTVLTYEQKFDGDRLDVEVGRTNALRAFVLPVCPNLVSCWNDVVEQDARTRTGHTAGWGGRAAYNLTPELYIQGGVYEDNPDAEAEHGFNFGATKSIGAIALGEIGYKSDFTTAKYPARFEAIGFYNTSTVADPYFTANGLSKAFNPNDPVRMGTGDGGFVLQAIKTVWRADGGRDNNLHPTALEAYASVSGSTASTAPVRAEAFAGVTLNAPFQSRPLDSVGAKVHWTQLSGSEQAFLVDSNIAAGGLGYFKPRDSFAFELNSHNEIGNFLSLNTTIQYFANNNNYWNPTSTKVSSDGFYFGMDATVPLGQLLGLSTLPY